jgi:hypothetical protein
MSKDKIFERIRNLLKLAESDNVHEAELALQRANDMMKEYAIAEHDLEMNPDTAKATYEVVTLTSSSEWVLLLSWYVCGAFGVHSMQTGSTKVRRGHLNKNVATKQMYFFGTDAKIKTAKLMIDFALESVKRITKAELARIKTLDHIIDSSGKRITIHKYMNAYRRGVVNGMGRTLQAIKKANENVNADKDKDRKYAIITLSEQDKAKALQDEMFPKTSQKRIRQSGDRGIFNSGTSAGEKVGFQKQARQGNTKLLNR